jgi:hypothetical protein
MADAFAHETLLDTPAAAKRLRVSQSFLAKARMKGTGPEYSKFGKLVRYTPANLDRYELEHSRISTAEEAPVTEQARKASAGAPSGDKLEERNTHGEGPTVDKPQPRRRWARGEARAPS